MLDRDTAHTKEIFLTPGTKLDNIKLLQYLGLPVPPTYIIDIYDSNWQKSLEEWLNQQPDDWSVQARTSSVSRDQQTRYLPSTRNQTPQKLLQELESQEWQKLVNDSERCVFIQALPPDALNRNLYSFQIMYDPVQQAYVLEIRHDIASTLAREGQTPDERVVIPRHVFEDLSPTQLAEYIQHHRQIVDLETQKRNFRYTLLRFGRAFLKEQGLKVPKLETLEYNAGVNEGALEGINKERMDSFLIEAIENIPEKDKDKFKAACKKLGIKIPGVKYNQEDQGDVKALPDVVKKGLETEKNLSLRHYLELIGVAYLLTVEPGEREYHTMYKMLKRILESDEAIYEPPSKEVYFQMMQHAKTLQEAGILEQYMPKASILDTHDLQGLSDITIYYWDLIESGYNQVLKEKDILHYPGKYRLLYSSEPLEQALNRIAQELYGMPFSKLPRVTQKFLTENYIREGD